MARVVARDARRAPVRWDAGASLRERRIESRRSRTSDLHAGLTWRWSNALTGSLDASSAAASEAASELTSRVYRTRLDWLAGPCALGLRAEYSNFRRAGSAETRQRSLGGDASLRCGRLDAALRLDLGSRDGADDSEPWHRSRRASDRAGGSLVRRF